MEILGIKFVPLNEPLQKRLQTLAAGAAVFTMIFGGFIGFILLAYLIFYTRYWSVALLYILWIYVLDVKTGERGGRGLNSVRSWLWWKYLRDYFPIRLERVPWVELDPERNYLFCCFPHGILPIGPFSAFGSSWGGFQELFPNHTPHLLTLRHNFLMPALRELILSTGMCSASANSLNYLLGYPGGGKAIALVVGGAAEAFNCKPGQYKIILKKRKGFVKIALKNGTPLVPVISFGETDLYNQVDNPKGSLIRCIQDKLKDVTGIAFALPVGCGLFQYSFGIIPLRRRISTIIGRPIEVKRVSNPTQEQVDELHAEFMKQLANLFEEQKYNYLSNPEQTKLIIE
ncbi:hypothetical protein ILUMI_25508 [Ignelater luminosus]|uniref:Acyltransferase n=1 Tax=Ignelater luminosus TaxID=2038154 RepID=A0A8K0C7B3_IGNLU|nr:hypothetical protein ILUMI_25508 [Ignelater luminosus]